MTRAKQQVSIQVKLRSTALVLILLASLSPAWAQELSAQSSKGGAPLQGGVSHLEVIEPLQQGFRTGEVYDARRTPDNTEQGFWYQIPAWSAGSWHGEVSHAVIQNDDDFSAHHPKLRAFGKLLTNPANATREETRVTRNNENWGFQRDRNGGIWQFANSNYSSRTDNENSYSISFVRSKSVLKNTADEVRIKFIGTQIHIDAKTNRILSSLQVESIQTYTQLAHDERKDVASIKSFDENGKPVTVEVITSVQKRVKPFQIRNTLKGKDMFDSFVTYLKEHHLTNLVPVEKAADGQS